MISLPSLSSAHVRGKRVFVRCDFDVPIDFSGKVADDTRLISVVSTIEYLLEEGAVVIAAGHLGRPGDQSQMFDNKFSLKFVVDWFAKEFPGTDPKETHLGGFAGWKLRDNFYILENLRFDNGEESNDSSFSHKLAYIADIFVNEAFGASHRQHASIVGVARLLPHFAGFHFQKEVRMLSSIIENPRRPFTFIIGGAKIETKLPLISKMHKFADYVLVGGEIAEQDKILIEEQHRNTTEQKAALLVADLNSEKSDITQNSLENFLQFVNRSKCIVWNGPMGKIEIANRDKDTSISTLKLAEGIISSGAYKVVGGGDTIGFLNKNKLLYKFDFASVGGGAMLEFLSGESLPGIIVLST